MVAPVTARPPQWTVLHRGTSKPGQNELEQAARLERVMRKVTVVASRHPQRLKDITRDRKADDAPRAHRKRCKQADAMNTEHDSRRSDVHPPLARGGRGSGFEHRKSERDSPRRAAPSQSCHSERGLHVGECASGKGQPTQLDKTCPSHDRACAHSCSRFLSPGPTLSRKRFQACCTCGSLLRCRRPRDGLSRARSSHSLTSGSFDHR